MPRSVRVLVVEDDQAVRDLVAQTLRDGGFDPVAVPDGAAALALVEPPQRWRPDLILLDEHPPRIHGPAFVRAYGQVPGPHGPVVLLTGAGAVDAADRAEALGAVGFLRKPFDLDALLALVQRHTGGTRGGAAET